MRIFMHNCKLLASRERIDERLIRKDSDSIFKMHHYRAKVCLDKKNPNKLGSKADFIH